MTSESFKQRMMDMYPFVADYAKELSLASKLSDPEMILLKGHLVLERLLSTAVAGRLGVAQRALPKLAFGTLVALAFLDDHQLQRELVWLNDLRNVLAHELHPFDSRSYAKLIGRFGYQWPSSGPDRRRFMAEFLFALGFRLYRSLLPNRDEDKVIKRMDHVIGEKRRQLLERWGLTA